MSTGSWRRTLVEGAVIVSSILLAFAIDASWDSSRERQRRDALLSALDREMTLATTERERVVGFHTGGLRAAGALLTLAPEERTVAVVDSLLRDAYGNTATFDAPSGALGGLLSSSDLDLVADDDLLLELTSYPGVVANLGREQEYLIEVGFRLLEYLSDRGVDVSLLSHGAAGAGTSDPVPWPPGSTTAVSIVGDPGFRGHMSELWWRYRNSLSAMEDLGVSIERIRERIAPSANPSDLPPPGGAP